MKLKYLFAFAAAAALALGACEEPENHSDNKESSGALQDTKGTLAEPQPTTPPKRADNNKNNGHEQPEQPGQPGQPETPETPSQPWRPPTPEEFHAGRGLGTGKFVALDSYSDPSVDACTAEETEGAADYFIISSEDDARSYLSHEFLSAHPEFVDPLDYGKQILVYRFFTTRDNSHIQINFVERLSKAVSIDLSYFVFGEATTHPLYTQMIAVWLSTETVADDTPILLHIHSEQR